MALNAAQNTTLITTLNAALNNVLKNFKRVFDLVDTKKILLAITFNYFEHLSKTIRLTNECRCVP